MTNQVEIKGITYNIKAEIEIKGNNVNTDFYKTMIILVRPKGNKEFWAMRNINGVVEIN